MPRVYSGLPIGSYIIQDDVCFLCVADRTYPRKLAFTYLADLATEFTTTYPASQYLSSNLRPYAFVEFDTFIQRTKKTYQDTRATANLDRLNDELRDVTKVMTKNIEDLLYRGDSLERMGEMSGRLREDSLKYRKAAVRINWELLIKQVRVSFLFASQDTDSERSMDHLAQSLSLSLFFSGGGFFRESAQHNKDTPCSSPVL